MEKLYTIGRFVSAVLRSYTQSLRPDIVLESVTDMDTGKDVTAIALGKIAMSLPLSDPSTDRKLIIRYTYKGTGPYQYIGSTFPPHLPTREIVPPTEQIIMAELMEKDEEDPRDVTEDMIAFAGPDGTFHGRSTDLMIACAYYGALELTYADGGTKTYTREQQ